MSDLQGVRLLDDRPTTAKLATLAGAVPTERPPKLGKLQR